jgi:hypothetical protein
MISVPTRACACALLIFAASCASKDDTRVATSSRQIDLAPGKAAQPQLADVPALPPAPPTATAKAPAKTPPRAGAAPTPSPEPTPEPTRAPTVAPSAAAPAGAPATTPTPAPASPATGTVAVGSLLTLRPAARICTNTHRAGDRFTATLSTAAHGSNGAEVPAGSVAVLRIVDAPKNVGAKDSLRLAYDLLSVRVGEETYEVNAHVTQSSPLERVNTQSTTDKAKKIGAGAAIGAIAGRILGGNTKSTVIGGAVGAAAGAAVAAGSGEFNGCLRDDGTITLALDRPLTITLAPKSP